MPDLPENPKIIMRQLKAVQQANDPNYKIWIPDKDNMLDIHFSVRGPLNTEYQGGAYHGQLLLPKEYPFRAPHVRMITPSGRFETNTNICFSFTAFHPEQWSPAVGFGPIIIGLQSLFQEYKERAVGMISNPSQSEIKKCVETSQSFSCPKCAISHVGMFKAPVESIENKKD
ncbi:Ubiquitin-conjugating enzyme E2 [Spironucleus salmonicida]|uniref:Ubiquitin-conjugating enzyme E2 n=1 Tax=Spironucleus salmonicida TaxID=348837 RepID=V6LB67_9EUKA|nr:Ubiquitin-conjugating enzyme E2 [Spironucleus salmonicida]|eukprot:EST41670.1 Ubiquitin-conjugating enzyme E2 [Spironucleus salmonicida]